jgi:hypothetical protein
VYYFVDPIVTTQRSINMLISIGVAFSIFVCHRVSFFVLLFFNFVFFSFGYSCRSVSENRFHHLMRMRTEATGVAQVAATIAVVVTRTEALNPAAFILAAMTTPMMTTPSRHQQLQIQAGQHHPHLLAIYNVCQRETGAPSEFTTL